MPRKLLLGIVALLALGYVAICAWIYIKQRDLMYFPQATKGNHRPADFGIARDDVMLNGWLVNTGQKNAVIYFGGNAERIEDNRGQFARWFPGSTVYLLPYRGYGPNQGMPSESALFGDALALYDQVHARQPAAPITVIGRSLGSGIASYVASKRPVAKLALVTPFDSMAAVAQAHYRWLPVRCLLQDRYESTHYLMNYAGPILVVRAGQDQVIPAANTAHLIASLAKPPQIVDLPGTDHNTISNDPAYGKALAAFASMPPSH